MAYVMLVAAVITSALVTGLCFALKWRKVYVIAPLQFIAALAVTILIGPRVARDAYTDDALVVALVISAAMPILFIILRLVAGRLDKREAGGLVGHKQEQSGSSS